MRQSRQGRGIVHRILTRRGQDHHARQPLVRVPGRQRSEDGGQRIADQLLHAAWRARTRGIEGTRGAQLGLDEFSPRTRHRSGARRLRSPETQRQVGERRSARGRFQCPAPELPRGTRLTCTTGAGARGIERHLRTLPRLPRGSQRQREHAAHHSHPALAAWCACRYLTGTHMSLRSCAHQ